MQPARGMAELIFFICMRVGFPLYFNFPSHLPEMSFKLFKLAIITLNQFTAYRHRDFFIRQTHVFLVCQKFCFNFFPKILSQAKSEGS